MRCMICRSRRLPLSLGIAIALVVGCLGFAVGFLVNNYQIRVWQTTESARFQQAVDHLMEVLEKK